jgi:hypothetical protein
MIIDHSDPGASAKVSRRMAREPDPPPMTPPPDTLPVMPLAVSEGVRDGVRVPDAVDVSDGDGDGDRLADGVFVGVVVSVSEGEGVRVCDCD